MMSYEPHLVAVSAAAAVLDLSLSRPRSAGTGTCSAVLRRSWRGIRLGHAIGQSRRGGRGCCVDGVWFYQDYEWDSGINQSRQRCSEDEF